MNSQEFTCKCGKYKGWVTEGKETAPCRGCARIYIGEYNEKTYTIDAVEVDVGMNKVKKFSKKNDKCILIMFYPIFFIIYLFIDIRDSITSFHKSFVNVLKNT